MADNNTPQNSSALDSFLAKLGTVLSMTKDAIIADFVGDIPSYVSNLASTEEIKDYDTFKKSFADSADALEKFITYIFNRLGYDLTTFKKNKELVDLVKSLLVTMDSLGTTVSELFGDDIKWMDEAEKLAKSAQEEGGVLQSADKIYKDISGKEQGLIASLGEGAISFGSSTENDGKLVKIIQTIAQIVELIIKFKDFEWSNIKNEYKDFGKFVDKTYFNEKFAERLFDHILTVLLSKAKEVFDDEIKAVAKNIEAFKKDIERTVAEAKGQIEKSASEILKEIKALEKQIEQIRKQIESEATRLYNEARQQALAAKKQIEGTVQDFYNQVSGELQAQYRTLENELLALTKTSLGDFGKIGDILNRVYQVLDFMGLLEKKTIEIATYVEGVGIKDLNIPVSEIDALLSVAVPAYDGKTPAADLQKKADEAIAELKSKIPTVEINVISWSRLGQIFTSPENYFKEVFPVKDYDDAEKLLAKISNLVRSFNPDIPDFSSVSKIINELLVRVQKAIDELPGDATKELKDKINAVKKFLLDIKKVLECYAIAFKKQISEAFDTVKGGADSIIKQLSTDVQKAVSEARAELEKSGKGLLTLAQTNIKWRDFSSLKMDAGTKDFLYRTFGKPFEEVVIENAAEYKLLEGIDPKEWGSAVTKAFSEVGSSGSSLVNGYVDIIKEIEKRIKDTFDSKAWEAKFDKLTGELKTEFEKQTAGIPMNVDQLKSFSEDTLKKLINGDKVDNPFSSFDFSEYLSIVSDNVKAIVPTDLDIYYTKFRTVTVDGINGILTSVSGISTAIDSTAKDLKTTAEDKADALKNFAIDVFTEYWDKLKDSIIKNVIRPVLTLIEKAVKEWTKKLLERILSEVIAYVKSLDINPQDYQKALSEAKETAEATVKTVSQILMVADDVKKNGVNSWKDGLSLAIKIYGIIPDEVKDYVKGLIRLPEFDFSNISLPEYKLDVDSKFLAVTIYELKPTGTKSLKAKIDGTVSIQLLAFVGDKTYDDQKDEDGEPLVKSGLYILPYIKGSLQSEFNIGESHKLSLNASASLNDGYEKPAKKDAKEEKAAKEAEEAIQKGKIGFFITTKDGWAFDAEPLADTSAIKAYLELLFARGQIGKKSQPLVIYSSDVLSITAEDYPQKGWVGYSDGFDAGYKGEIQNLDFTLSLKKVNSFFDTILSDDIKFKLDKLSLGYSYKKGFEIEGEASVRIPINTKIDLKAARLSNLAIELAFPDFRGVEFGISTNLSADLNCVKFTLGDVGFGLKTEIFDDNYKLKGFNLSPSFLLPDGIGISVDIEKTIKGTGALKWNKDTGEIVGAAELIILEMCGASAMFILNTKPVDGAKFSFMGALCVYFTPSIQIGMGFSISAIGGSLGLNRRIDTDKMIEAVRNGSLSTILFVKDLDKNLDTVLGNMSSYYPVAKNTFFFGALAQISWAEKFKIEFGLFIQAPDPVLIIIAGGLHFSVAEQADKLLSINANFLGIIDFSKGISFDADLVDSHIVGIELHGSLALRIYWAGDTKGFILSAGGFHPQYTPEAGFNVGGMKRLGMKLDYSILKISMDSYFAVTSNTVQFGSDSRLQVGWDKFGLLGYMYYNALFQFKPFAFMFDAGIGVSVKCGSWTLMSLSLDLDVSGPAPWRVKGNASFWFILVKIKVSFDKSWGKKQKIGEKGTTGVFALYCNNFEDSRNWTVISTDMSEGLVVLAEYTGTELMMSPSDTLMFNQTEVPLDQKMEKFGETVPDCQSINLKSIEVAVGQITTEIKNVQTIKDSFAPSVFKNMKEDEKLSSPSYVKMNSGFKLKEGGESRTGNFKKVDSPADKTIESLDIATWREAIAYASKTSVGTDKKSEPVLPKELALSHYSSFKSKPGKVAKEVQSVKGRTFKASSRRTNDGFRRYIAAMDGSICQDMSELKAKLNETSEA